MTTQTKQSEMQPIDRMAETMRQSMHDGSARIDFEGGIYVRCTFDPPKYYGKPDKDWKHVQQERFLFTFELYMPAQDFADQARGHLDDDICGWRGINDSDVLALLEGVSYGEIEAKHDAAADAFFARLAARR